MIYTSNSSTYRPPDYYFGLWFSGNKHTDLTMVVSKEIILTDSVLQTAIASSDRQRKLTILELKMERKFTALLQVFDNRVHSKRIQFLRR